LSSQPTAISNNNNSSGMFDNFLQRYASSISVMDEPELSFVSSTHSSQANSPPSRRTSSSSITSAQSLARGDKQNAATAQSLSTTCHNEYNYAATTGMKGSSLSNNNDDLSNTSGFNSSNSVTALIQLQKRQLSNQFADVSPIVSISSHSKNAYGHSISASSIGSYANTLSYETNDKN
jgi:hypothetical protein